MIGNNVRNSSQVWDTTKMKWALFDEVYKENITKKIPISSGSPTSSDSITASGNAVTYAGVPPITISNKDWENYQKNLASSIENPGKEGGETFSGFNEKIVMVDSPSFNGNIASKKWSLELDPEKTCPPDICLNDITLKSKKVNEKKGVMIHATVGHTYLALASWWNSDSVDAYGCHQKSVDYWNKKYSSKCGIWPSSIMEPDGTENQVILDSKQIEMAECAKQINPKERNSGFRKSVKTCLGLGSHTHYIFGRDGNYAQHASEYASIWHSSTGKGDNKIPVEQWDTNTIAIEVANAVSSCQTICKTGSTKNYKGKSAIDCLPSDCIKPISLWGSKNNYLPNSDKIYSSFNQKSYEKYSDEQIKGLIKLVAEIMIRHNIKMNNLIRHADNTWRGSGSDHTDPGVAFDWMGFRKSVCQAINEYKGISASCGNEKVACYGCGLVSNPMS